VRNAPRRRGQRALDWIGRFAGHTVGALLGLAAGLSIGWLFGSLTACSGTGCKANAAAIEAAGTWVGGLGTIAAVFFATNQFRAEQRHRVQEQMRRDAETREAKRAAAAEAQAEDDRLWEEADSVAIHVELALLDQPGGEPAYAELS
jgi:hypothetical protein